MKTVTIDRAKWARHVPGDLKSDDILMGGSMMLNHKGNLCCLGHICRAYGAKDANLKNCTSPYSVASGETYHDTERTVPDFLLTEDECADGFRMLNNSLLTKKAISINDAYTTTKQKEKKLKKLFEGILNLEFVGRTPRRKKD